MISTATIRSILQNYELAQGQAARSVGQALEQEISANDSGLGVNLILGTFGTVVAWDNVENFYCEVFRISEQEEQSDYEDPIFFLTVIQHMSYASIAAREENEYKKLATGSLFLVRDRSQHLVDISFPIYRVDKLDTPFFFYRVVAEKFFPARFTNWATNCAGQTTLWNTPEAALMNQIGPIKYRLAIGTGAIDSILNF